MARPESARAFVDPLRRLRRRVLLVSAPLVFIFALTDRLVLHGRAFWAAFGVRLLWGATLVAAALWAPRLGATGEGRALTAVGFTTPLFFAVLAVLTGGTASPLFHFIVAMPLVVAVVLQDQPRATLAATLAMLASGVFIVGREAGGASSIAPWLVQAAGMGGLAVYASVAYRRLRLHLDAAREAEAEASGRARSFERELEAREAFLSVASHELKTPMTSLFLQVESLRRLDSASEPSGPAHELKVASKHAVIARQMRRLSTLVDSLLDASRIQSGRMAIAPEQVELVHLVKTSLLSFEEDAGTVGSELKLFVGRAPVSLAADKVQSGSGPKVTGHWDPHRLQQVLGNLVANALRYGAGAPIEVTLSPTEERVTIAVRDHGIGIAPADQGRIFERFEQISTDRAAGGLGLGLWITQQLVEAMRGRVLVTSAPGDGSTFTIELPRHTAPATVRVARALP